MKTTPAQAAQRRIMSSQLFTAKREREKKAEENRRGAATVGTDADIAAYLARTLTKRSRILAALSEGPSTTSEIAATTGLGLKHCCAQMRSLWQSGRLTRSSALVGRGHIYSIVGAR